MLARGGTICSTCSCFSYSSNAICLGLCGVCLCVAGGLVSASPSCSGILRGVLFCVVLVAVVVKGREDKNDLFCHLGAVPTLFNLLYKLCSEDTILLRK